MLPIAILASGNGSNLQAIIDAIESHKLDAKIQCVISDRKSAFALERAKKHNIPNYFINPKDYSTREEHENSLAQKLKEHQVQLIVLAGYMRLLTSSFVQMYKSKIINIHPALLPSFPGAHGIEDAFKYGVKITGVSVHFVDDGVDTGPIISQVPVEIKDTDTLETLEQRIREQEHQLYPKVIQLFAQSRIRLDGRKVIIK
jgi:phosphoribosylglycinamide formyltransferase 1